MPNYMVRVELHNIANEEALYTRLHDAMEDKGFFRWIQSSAGVNFHLPRGQYRLDGSLWTARKVTNDAKIIANSVHINNTIFVSNYSAWSSKDLRLLSSREREAIRLRALIRRLSIKAR